MKNILYVLMACALLQLSSCTSRVYVSGGSPAYNPAPPPWAAGHVYRSSMRYYYVPDIMLYYDTFTGNYFWYDGYVWQRSMRLPAMYASFNFRTTYYTQINYRGSRPYADNSRHHRMYARSRSVNNGTPRVDRRAPVQNNRVSSREVNRRVAPSNDRRVEAPVNRNSRVQSAPARSSRSPQVQSAPARSGRGTQIRSNPSNSRSSGRMSSPASRGMSRR